MNTWKINFKFTRCAFFARAAIVAGMTGIALTLVLTSGSPAWAHHGVASLDAENKIELEGEIIEFLFQNPHPRIRFMAKNEEGDMDEWAADTNSISSLYRAGILEDALKPGDRVVVEGNPAKDRSLRVMRITRVVFKEDGRTLILFGDNIGSYAAGDVP